MKLAEQITSQFTYKKKKNNFLIPAMEKLKYHDILSILDVIDNEKFLNTFSSGWNTSHYAALNNPEVFIFIINLYLKNNCDINQLIQREKNKVKIQSNTMDITISNQKLDNYILLKEFSTLNHENLSYYMQKDNHGYGDKEVIELELPYEYSIINLFLVRNSDEGFRLLRNDFDYEEKPKLLNEFMENHKYLCEKHNIFEHDYRINFIYNYKEVMEKIIKLKDELDLNFFDYFAIFLITAFKKQKQLIIEFPLRSFQNIFKDDQNSFFKDLDNSKYKEEMISTFFKMKNMQIINKNIKGFFDYFKIENFLLSKDLLEKLPIKNTNNKTNKI